MPISPIRSGGYLPLLPPTIASLHAGGLSLGKVFKDAVAFNMIDSFLDAMDQNRCCRCSSRYIYTLTPDRTLQRLLHDAIAMSTLSILA